jgi:hypothetical protein
MTPVYMFEHRIIENKKIYKSSTTKKIGYQRSSGLRCNIGRKTNRRILSIS